ncbi:MAG: hypothetical protein MUE44_15115 [Oscillatoriaceae cyanobacterium Prado104]|jgi:hypothetical protein|nr:hypothetical protein [Oscillatoriaceae cyanobacterium Prado104]
MLGFQDFTSTNSYGYDYGWGYYYDPLMTTALLSDLNSPYSYGTNTYGSYGTIAGATPVSNANSANSDIAVVDSLLAEALGIYQGSGTSATAPVSNFSSPNTATVGSVGVGHKTGDPLVDSLLNQSDLVIADNKSWLDSLPKDPLTGMLLSSQSTFDSQVQSALGEANQLLAGGGQLLNSTGNSASMLPSSFLYGWLTPQISTIKNPNTTDPQLNQINRQNKRAGQIYGGQAIEQGMRNSINKGEQPQNKHKFDSYNTFGSGPEYDRLNGEDWTGYNNLDGSYTSYTS